MRREKIYLKDKERYFDYYLDDDNVIFRFYRSKAACPCCGKISNKRKTQAQSKLKQIVDFPFTDQDGKLRQIHGIFTKRFFCINPECEKYRRSFNDTLNGYLLNNQKITSHFWDFICILRSIMGTHIYTPIVNGLLSDETEHWKPNNLVALTKKYAEQHPLIIDGENVLLVNKSSLTEMPMRQSRVDYSYFISVCIEKFRHFYTYEDYKEMLFSYCNKEETTRIPFYKSTIEILEMAAQKDISDLSFDKNKYYFVPKIKPEKKTNPVDSHKQNNIYDSISFGTGILEQLYREIHGEIQDDDPSINPQQTKKNISFFNDFDVVCFLKTNKDCLSETIIKTIHNIVQSCPLKNISDSEALYTEAFDPFDDFPLESEWDDDFFDYQDHKQGQDDSYDSYNSYGSYDDFEADYAIPSPAETNVEYSDSDYIQFYKEGDSGTDASSDTPITENDVLDYLEECLTDPDFYKHHIELLYLCYYIDQES